MTAVDQIEGVHRNFLSASHEATLARTLCEQQALSVPVIQFDKDTTVLTAFLEASGEKCVGVPLGCFGDAPFAAAMMRRHYDPEQPVTQV